MCCMCVLGEDTVGMGRLNLYRRVGRAIGFEETESGRDMKAIIWIGLNLQTGGE